VEARCGQPNQSSIHKESDLPDWSDLSDKAGSSNLPKNNMQILNHEQLEKKSCLAASNSVTLGNAG
jgi:hypothetical protein